MKKIILLNTSIFLIVFLLSCEKIKNNWLFPSGITVVDDKGNILYRDKDGDWCKSSIHPYKVAGGLPTSYRFGPAYPNPSTDRTIIPYALPENSWVRLWIVDKFGQEVIVLVENYEAAGYKFVSWNFVNTNGDKVIPGIYRALIIAGRFGCYGDILVE